MRESVSFNRAKLPDLRNAVIQLLSIRLPQTCTDCTSGTLFSDDADGRFQETEPVAKTAITHKTPFFASDSSFGRTWRVGVLRVPWQPATRIREDLAFLHHGSVGIEAKMDGPRYQLAVGRST